MFICSLTKQAIGIHLFSLSVAARNISVVATEGN
jgi:hypothetical protein